MLESINNLQACWVLLKSPAVLYKWNRKLKMKETCLHIEVSSEYNLGFIHSRSHRLTQLFLIFWYWWEGATGWMFTTGLGSFQGLLHPLAWSLASFLKVRTQQPITSFSWLPLLACWHWIVILWVVSSILGPIWKVPEIYS